MKVPFQTILCPTDLSAIGNLAVPVAYRLAADRGTVHLLHVAEPPFLGNPLYNQFAVGYVPSQEERQAGEDRVKTELHQLPPKAEADRGVRTEYHVVQGITVADAIEEQAQKLGADVVVLGTHGRTGLSRLVMGSVAADVVKKENLPVILVHQDLEDTPRPE